MIRTSKDFAIVFEGRGFHNRRIVTNAIDLTKLQVREIVLQYEAVGLSELYASGQNAKSRKRRRKGRFMDSGSRETMYVLWKGSRPRGCEKLWQHVGRQAPLTSDILTNIPVMHPDELPRCSVIEKAAARGATIIHNNAIPASEESAGDGESEESESPKKIKRGDTGEDRI